MVKSVDDMIELLDEDEDGFLNEDEQMLMFLIIKERLQVSANELCDIHEYGLYKELMESIRMIEPEIVKYQNILRHRTHANEMKLYHEIGRDKKKEFEEG